MNDFFYRAEQFVKEAMYFFMVERDEVSFLSCMAPEITLISANDGQLCKDLKAVIAFTHENIKAYPEAFILKEEQYFVSPLSEDTCCVMAKAFGVSNKGVGLNILGSFFVKQFRGQALRLVHIHVSVSDMHHQIQEKMQGKRSECDFPLVEKLLKDKTLELNNFYSIIADGIGKFAFCEDFTLLYCNDRLLELVGLSRDEIKANHNRTVDYIMEEDIGRLTEVWQKALEGDKRFSVQYRIKHKSGKLIWVNLTGIFSDELYQETIPVLYCIFTDITELVKSYEQLALEKERYRMIIELVEGITFEYDMINDTMEFPNKYEKYFDCPAVIPHFKKTLTKDFFATEDEFFECQKLCQVIGYGQTHVNTELRLKTRDGSWIWFSVMLCTLLDDQQRPIKTIGKLADINQQKLIQEELENKSHLDPMTKLYHKISAQNQISVYLANKAPDTLAALFIVDIDNFKIINDTMGHFVGDHVIRFIAEEMKKIFRSTDVISRFGGDEYMILMKDIYAESLVIEKAALLHKSIANAFHLDREGYQVTVSIGIAMVEEALMTYQQLFQWADKALYSAKNKGKNRFEVYNSTTEVARLSHDSLSNKQLVKFYAQGQSYQMIVDTALDILLQSDGIETANNILRFLGISLKLSQAYTSIFLQHKIKVIAHWSSTDIDPLPELIDLNKEALLANFNSDGVFLCSDTSLLPSPSKEICVGLNNGALLQCLVYRGNQIVGFVGFSDSKVLRVWTQNEIDILQTVTKIITDTVIKIVDKDSNENQITK